MVSYLRHKYHQASVPQTSIRHEISRDENGGKSRQLCWLFPFAWGAGEFDAVARMVSYATVRVHLGNRVGDSRAREDGRAYGVLDLVELKAGGQQTGTDSH